MKAPVKFLLVDDIEENLLALEALLRQDGLEMLMTRSGPEALELLLEHDFALALIDVQMPGMSGFDLAELMRGTARTRRVPIIFLTAGSSDEQRRFKGYEAGAVVDYLEKPIDSHMLRRKAEVFFQLDQQRRALLASEQRFRRSLMQAASPVMLFDEQGEIITVNDEWTACLGYGRGELGDIRNWASRVSGAHACEVLELAQQVMIGQSERARMELDVTSKNGARHTWDLVFSAAGPGVDGRGIFVCLAHDITERVQAERVRKLLVDELNHRVRNNLTTVLAIAKQTLKQTRDPQQFESSFMGRILALSRAHSLLSAETWRGANLRDLVRDQMSLGCTEEGRVVQSGDAVLLEPQTALHVALMLHELVTNAAKYGAIACPLGRITIAWTVQNQELQLSWMERGGPPVIPPSRRGFGTVLIERSAIACSGSAKAKYDTEGVTWDITLPLVRVRPGSCCLDFPGLCGHRVGGD